MTFKQDTKIANHLSRWLDLFRGLAAVFVLLGHASALVFPEGTSGLIGKALPISHGAVIVFFVLSGYLVGGPFLVRTMQGRSDIASYASARVSRMYVVLLPALALTVLCDAITMSIFDGQTFIDARTWFFPNRTDLWADLSLMTAGCNAAFLQTLYCHQIGSNLSLWSISNEGLYYAAWLGIVLSVQRPALTIIPLGLAAALVASHLAVGSPTRSLHYLVYFAIWTLGAITFCARAPIVAFAAALATSIIGYVITRHNLLPSDGFLGVGFASLIKLLELSDAPYPRRDFGLSYSTATISFSLYAVHLPIAVLLTAASGIVRPLPYDLHSVALYGFLVATTIAISTIFWWLFERRTPAVRHWLRTSLGRFGVALE